MLRRLLAIRLRVGTLSIPPLLLPVLLLLLGVALVVTLLRRTAWVSCKHDAWSEASVAQELGGPGSCSALECRTY